MEYGTSFGMLDHFQLSHLPYLCVRVGNRRLTTTTTAAAAAAAAVLFYSKQKHTHTHTNECECENVYVCYHCFISFAIRNEHVARLRNPCA